MSRIGKVPVDIPQGVSLSFEGGQVLVNGPKGEVSCGTPPQVEIKAQDDQVVVERQDDGKQARAMQGLARTLVANMVLGVTEGFEKKLMVTGVGYRSELRGERFLLINLGFSHPVLYELPEGVSAVVNDKENSITIQGVNKQVVGSVAAEIRALRPPEPYKGKGVRYADEVIRRKEGKTSGK